MARRRHPHVPNAAKLASGVLVVGVCLGLLLAAAVNPVMKYTDEAWWPPSGDAEPVAVSTHMEWLNATPQVTGGFRPDFDYDEVIGAEWALPEAETGIAPELLPPIEGAFDAPDEAAEAAAAAQEAADEARPMEAETGTAARKSALVQDGLY